MTNPNGRADDRLAAWAAATNRPVPPFQRRAARRGGLTRSVLLALVVIALIGAVVGTFVFVGGRGTPPETASPTELATGAAQALATAPGIDYRLGIMVDHDVADNAELNSTGTVDYTTRRFSGTADAGNTEFMLLFGGPKSGAVVIADGRFVKTENGPWEEVADEPSPFDGLLDRDAISRAFLLALDGAQLDPAVGSVACGSETCRTVNAIVAPAGFGAAVNAIFGGNAAVAPEDLGPIAVVLHIDEDGFLRHLEARGTAGDSTTTVVLDLNRLDAPPAIVRPIP